MTRVKDKDIRDKKAQTVALAIRQLPGLGANYVTNNVPRAGLPLYLFKYIQDCQNEHSKLGVNNV